MDGLNCLSNETLSQNGSTSGIDFVKLHFGQIFTLYGKIKKIIQNLHILF
jgi:hypothetical protein